MGIDSTLGVGSIFVEGFAGVRASKNLCGLAAGVSLSRVFGNVSAFASVFTSAFRTCRLGRTGADDMLPVELASTGLRVVKSEDLGLWTISSFAPKSSSIAKSTVG